ncbi:MAG: DM9 repeat-containing protein [Spirochaetota bacterium]
MDIRKSILAILFCISLFHLAAEEPVWQSSQGKLPYGARWIGMEEKLSSGKVLQMGICRGLYNDVVYPGRYSQMKCSIGYDGKEILLEKFEVLMHKNSVRFVKLRNFKSNLAIPAGGELSDISYICISKFRNNWYPGRLQENACRFGYNGDEIKSTISVHVLVSSNQP